MAPEVINSQPYGPASDFWSLGVILYELLTFRRPFDADNIGALVNKISSGALDEEALSESPHCEGLRALASRDGLLHQDPTDRVDADGLRVRLLDLMWSEEAGSAALGEVATQAERQKLLAAIEPSSIDTGGGSLADGGSTASVGSSDSAAARPQRLCGVRMT